VRPPRTEPSSIRLFDHFVNREIDNGSGGSVTVGEEPDDPEQDDCHREHQHHRNKGVRNEDNHRAGDRDDHQPDNEVAKKTTKHS
jgi:hypothetical protein